LERELQALTTLLGVKEKRMKYGVAWLLGVPVSIIALWFLAGQIGCGV
jgi:hypothetical protein